MAYLVWHKINKKSWIIMIKLGGHVLRSPGRFTSSLWSWSRCQMKDILEIFIILKDWVLSVNRCLFTSRWSFPTLKMWFPGSNFGLILRYQPSIWLTFIIILSPPPGGWTSGTVLDTMRSHGPTRSTSFLQGSRVTPQTCPQSSSTHSMTLGPHSSLQSSSGRTLPGCCSTG